MKALQDEAINQRNKNDIEFNFVIGEQGIFEGRGWEVQSEESSNKGGFYFNIGIFEERESWFEKLSKLLKDGQVLDKIGKLEEMTCELQFQVWCNATMLSQ